jgi:hypothetical protein
LPQARKLIGKIVAHDFQHLVDQFLTTAAVQVNDRREVYVGTEKQTHQYGCAPQVIRLKLALFSRSQYSTYWENQAGAMCRALTPRRNMRNFLSELLSSYSIEVVLCCISSRASDLFPLGEEKKSVNNSGSPLF